MFIKYLSDRYIRYFILLNIDIKYNLNSIYTYRKELDLVNITRININKDVKEKITSLSKSSKELIIDFKYKKIKTKLFNRLPQGLKILILVNLDSPIEQLKLGFRFPQSLKKLIIVGKSIPTDELSKLRPDLIIVFIKI